MDIRELDRLITKTELTPLNKKALRNVRKAILGGQVGEPVVNAATWSIGIDTEYGNPVRVTFSFKRD